MNPVSILIHSGAPNDAKLFDEINEKSAKKTNYTKRKHINL